MKDLDKKDCQILNILQQNSRTSLTDIAKKIGLSIDSTKKRVKKLLEKVIFSPTIHICPKNFGYGNIVDVKIKLSNHSKEDVNEFIEFLKQNPRVTEIFEVGGSWDLTVVIISKNIDDLEKVSSEIKEKFGNNILLWEESTTLKCHKFEEYDMTQLLGFDK